MQVSFFRFLFSFLLLSFVAGCPKTSGGSVKEENLDQTGGNGGSNNQRVGVPMHPWEAQAGWIEFKLC